MISIALYQPDIPQNVGSALRLCACFDVPCHIIEPCGFVYDDKKLKRVAMDYAELTVPVRHNSWEAFLNWRRENDSPRLILLSSKAKTYHHEFTFRPNDILLMGRESAGVPDAVRDACDASLRIPIAAHTRSLNVITAATVVLGEALRQTGAWPDQL
jgi:tRNA (cytidine/uridine-2'-O-)-methyltransferase